MPDEQWYAICDISTGEAISFGTVLGDFGDRCLAVKVDGPPDGRVWNAATRTYGEKVKPRKTRAERAAEAYAAAVTTDERVAAIAMALGIV